MNFNIIIAIIFGILALVLGVFDTIHASLSFNKEDKSGIVSNNVPSLFLFTGIIIIIIAMFYIYSQYQVLLL